MSVILTISDVKSFIPAANGVADADISMYIGVAARADACLDGASVDDDTQRLLKLSLIAHLLTKRFGGQVTSQEDMDGARIAWQQYATKGTGLNSTTFGQTVMALDANGCMAFVNKTHNRYIAAVGGV